ncbi:hypothetical protein V1477_018933 [Vespula maculifrons]|uniref:Uncharacterized protein n=1 Tax=Vespula maculifrons TaxID=7453 RepID=A0ABD2ASX8_VESMC
MEKHNYFTHSFNILCEEFCSRIPSRSGDTFPPVAATKWEHNYITHSFNIPCQLFYFRSTSKSGDAFAVVMTTNYWFSLALNLDEWTSQFPYSCSTHSTQKYIEKWGCFRSRDDNKVSYLTDFDSY